MNDVSWGTTDVDPRVNGLGGLTLVALALLLCGCSGTDFEANAWFNKPLNPLAGRNLGYTYSQLDETKQHRAVTANDLVDARGACPPQAGAPQASAAPGGAADGGATAYAATPLGERVGIGMTECEVVARVGAPTAVNIGTGRGGERSVVLTYQGGPRPGVYRFSGGRLAEMDRVDEPAPAPQPPAKKKPAKSAPQAKTNG